MNRTLLIVICDFLLLTLISTARLDQMPSLNSAPPSQLSLETYSSPSAQAPAASQSPIDPRAADVLDAMKSTLEEERTSRELLASTLSETEAALRAQQELAAQRQQQIESATKTIQAKEQEARIIEQARNRLATQYAEAQTNLSTFQKQLAATSAEARLSQERLNTVEQEFSKARDNLVSLEKELSSTSTEARLARERLTQIEDDLRSRQTEAEQARDRIDQVDRLRQAAELERERIAGALKVAESEQRMTKEQLATAQQEKAQIHKVATELAEGVVQFAEKQGELTKEIRENRPLSANSIFAEFITNRVNTDFRADRSGVLGRNISKDSQARTILVTDGAQTYALYHVSDTPFRIEEFGKDWERFIVHLYRGNTILPMDRILFLSMDPRVVVIPVSQQQAKQLGAKVYKTVSDPYKFQDALILGADEGYYGECRFALDPSNRGYLKMDRSALGKMVGRFNPSRGDLVLSKSGDLIGIMVNKQYCALLTSFVPRTTIPAGPNLNAQAIGTQLSAMQQDLRDLPMEKQ
ncbi:MAG TPA: hypothetical protein VM735_12055 [Candidatus Kapabacteria bacterium]|nr:hypothetical protein [Candidatus Kapabacteria bacterium]